MLRIFPAAELWMLFIMGSFLFPHLVRARHISTDELLNAWNDTEGRPVGRSPTARKLLEITYYDDVQGKWDYYKSYTFDTYSQKIRRGCRDFIVTTRARFLTPSHPLVRDAIVTDVETHIKALTLDGTTVAEVSDTTVNGLLSRLQSEGLAPEGKCLVGYFGHPLVVASGSCVPGFNITCDASCQFECDDPNYELIGSSSTTCHRDGTLSNPIPSCRAKKCSLGSFSKPLRSNCSPSSYVEIGTTCNFTCTPGYVLHGSSRVSCLEDAELSSALPTCLDENKSPHPTTLAPNADVKSTRQANSHPRTTSLFSAEYSTTDGKHRKGTETPMSTAQRITSLDSQLSATIITSSPENLASTTKHRDHDDIPVYTVKHTPTNDGRIDSVKHGPVNLWYAAIPAVCLSVAIFCSIYYLYRCRRQMRPYYVLDEEFDDDDVTPDGDGYYNQHIHPASPTAKQLNPHQVYPMDSCNKGLVYILNNNNFVALQSRLGSEIDVLNVKHVFEEIGYKAVLNRDLTADGIRQSLKRLCGQIKARHRSLVLVLMSHGGTDGIYGIDRKPVTVEEIKDMLSGRSCPALLDKPKIMFVQACRGEKITRSATDAGFLEESRVKPRDTAIDTDNATSSSPTMELRPSPVYPETDASLPENADIFIAYATSEGHFSLRHPGKGSWFIQALCEELIARVHLDDLDTIMTGVTRRVISREAVLRLHNQEYRTQQTPQITKQGIRKQIFFLPKYPSRDHGSAHESP